MDGDLKRDGNADSRKSSILVKLNETVSYAINRSVSFSQLLFLATDFVYFFVCFFLVCAVYFVFENYCAFI